MTVATTSVTSDDADSEVSETTPARSKVQEICCIGAGYVGGPTSAVIASKNPDIQVHVVDIDEARIQAWNSNDLPIIEPELLSIVKIGRDGTDGRKPNLHFSSRVADAIIEADLILIAVNTPTKVSGRGAKQALDISQVEAAAQMIAQVSRSDKIVVEKSTVPCGTSASLKEMFAATGYPGVKFEIVSNPEFLAEGTAVSNLLQPDRVLIGSEQTVDGLRAARILSHIYESWVPREVILFVNTQSAELTKLAANALLAQRISSMNALSAICEKTGADVEEVALACGLDPRIGPKMLKASLGFGGSCLKKDVLTLAYLSDNLDLTHIGSYWRCINDINEAQRSRFSESIVKKMNNTLVCKKIAVLGCAFKKGTGDIRESPGISVLADLLAERALVTVYDPKVQTSRLLDALNQDPRMSQLTVADGWRKRLTICSSAYDACNGAQSIVIATEWDEFSNRRNASNCKNDLRQFSKMTTTPVDWARIAASMHHPKLLFDGRNIVHDRELAKLGFDVHLIGKSSVSPKRDYLRLSL